MAIVAFCPKNPCVQNSVDNRNALLFPKDCTLPSILVSLPSLFLLVVGFAFPIGLFLALPLVLFYKDRMKTVINPDPCGQKIFDRDKNEVRCSFVESLLIRASNKYTFFSLGRNGGTLLRQSDECRERRTPSRLSLARLSQR